MHWLQEQKMESQIRQVTGQMMHRLVENAEYVVAMFLKDCDRSVEVKLQGDKSARGHRLCCHQNESCV